MLQLATPADREAVELLAQQVHSLHVSWRPDAYVDAEALYPEERFQAALGERKLYVAKLSGVVLGYVLLNFRDRQGPGRKKQRILLLEEICVREDCRGQGIGTEMMADVHALARAFRCDSLQLSVEAHNDAAVGFYQKCGFRIGTISMHKEL